MVCCTGKPGGYWIIERCVQLFVVYDIKWHLHITIVIYGEKYSDFAFFFQKVLIAVLALKMSENISANFHNRRYFGARHHFNTKMEP